MPALLTKAIEACIAAAALENRADATHRCADAPFVRHVNHDGRQPIGAAGLQTRAVLSRLTPAKTCMAPRVEPSSRTASPMPVDAPVMRNCMRDCSAESSYETSRAVRIVISRTGSETVRIHSRRAGNASGWRQSSRTTSICLMPHRDPKFVHDGRDSRFRNSARTSRRFIFSAQALGVAHDSALGFDSTCRPGP